jgi:hypothetical protein
MRQEVTTAAGADVPVGSFWLEIARQIIAHTAKSGGQPDFSATIQ